MKISELMMKDVSENRGISIEQQSLQHQEFSQQAKEPQDQQLVVSVLLSPSLPKPTVEDTTQISGPTNQLCEVTISLELNILSCLCVLHQQYIGLFAICSADLKLELGAIWEKSAPVTRPLSYILWVYQQIIQLISSPLSNNYVSFDNTAYA
ncbi:unnamed protein product [Ambrosiozyma monospora]|uniref:Unnamed protein product n=1 Tax=Ambrosiozyma monospora TaxID=43982 RepID=A0ACB5TDY6_AMBMO|nr:unnamed protein product [Ambrosiozyma monospora]